MVQCIGVASLHTCLSSKCPYVYLQWHTHAVSLFCGAALNSGEAFLPSYRCAMTQHQCTAALGRANCIPRCSVLLFQIASQLTCVTAITAEEMCSSYMCAVTQQQYTAELGRASCIPHSSVLPCNTCSQLACVTAITSEEICSSCYALLCSASHQPMHSVHEVSMACTQAACNAVCHSAHF